jgi:uncharacterized membrane protein
MEPITRKVLGTILALFGLTFLITSIVGLSGGRNPPLGVMYMVGAYLMFRGWPSHARRRRRDPDQ